MHRSTSIVGLLVIVCFSAVSRAEVLDPNSAAYGVYYGDPPREIISSQISRVHTPGCSYGSNPAVSNTSAPFPPLFLKECTQPIAPTAVDLRGWWKDPTKPDDVGERIEQCGLRIIITGGGIIHDTYIADGTLNNGVFDVTYSDCSPLNVAGLFNATSQMYTFYSENVGLNPPANVTPVVSRRRIDATTMQWIHPLAGTVNYTLVQDPSPIPDPLPLPCTARNTVIERGVRYVGPHLTDAITVPKFDACVAACKTKPSCNTFSYKTATRSCQLFEKKASQLTRRANPAYASGFIACVL